MIDQGSTINGRYRVDRQLGDGGMATVYLGHDILLGRDVAIKVLRGNYAADPASRVRFRREAQAAAGFSHPNIVDIYDVGEVAGTPYFVMEYVRGQTLKAIIDEEGPFHPDDVASLLQQVCSALDYAHERGYVHRDVKPQNILVDNDGHAIVVDFGIAKSVSDDNLTEAGDGLGTVHYLSPEQASGLMATPASDVYSAGVVAYEMLTKHVPFDAPTPVGVAVMHVQDEPPPPSAFLASIPPAIDAIIQRALAKDPTKRFPSAGAFASAMTYWRQYRPPALQTGKTDPYQPMQVGRATNASAATTVIPTTSPRRDSGATPPRRREQRRGGCVNWVIGTLALLGLIALIVFGFRLAGGFGPQQNQGPISVNPTPEPTTVANLITVEPEPTIPATAVTSSVSVPDLVGLTLGEATERLSAQGLNIAVGSTIATEAFPAGQVVYQSVAPGDVTEEGATIVVQLSSGSQSLDLRALGLPGMTAEQATQVLQSRGFLVSERYVNQPGTPPGIVVGLDPSTSAQPGSTVTLLVSQGNNVLIPEDIVGRPMEKVRSQLAELGITVRDVKNASPADLERAGLSPDAEGLKEGDVVWVEGVGQSVAVGAWVPPGTEVDLVVFRAKRTEP